MQKSKHKLEKELKRAERHKKWLRKNLPNTQIEEQNLKNIKQLSDEILLRA
jgi:hypothetical protein